MYVTGIQTWKLYSGGKEEERQLSELLCQNVFVEDWDLLSSSVTWCKFMFKKKYLDQSWEQKGYIYI